MKNIYLGLKFAFSYFSILPVTFAKDDDLSKKDVLKYMLLFFPLVGLVISSIVVSLYVLLTPSWYNALIASAIYMILYSFLHTEAISDVVDAIFAKHSGKDPYIVIKDPTIGAMGVLYTTVFIIVKLASLVMLLHQELYIQIVLISMFSRLSIVYIVHLNQFRSSFVNSLKNALDVKSIVVFTLFYFGFALYVQELLAIGYIVSILLVSYIVIKNIKSKLGFLNGDVLGLNLELNELILYMICIKIF